MYNTLSNLFCLSLLLCAFQSSGQVKAAFDNSTFNNLRVGESSFVTSNLVSYEDAINEYSSIKGNPYIYEDYKLAILEDNESLLMDSVLLKYDIYNNELCVLNANSKMLTLDKSEYKSFTFIEDSISYAKVNPNYGNQFKQVIFHSEDFVLFKEVKISLIDKTKHVAGTEINDRRFKRKSKYFIYSEGNGLQEVKLKKKKFHKYLPTVYRALWVVHIRKNKDFKLKDEADYGEALRYLEAQE